VNEWSREAFRGPSDYASALRGERFGKIRLGDLAVEHRPYFHVL